MIIDPTIQALIDRTLADPDVPEPVRNALSRGLTLEHIRLDARGRWWHQGEPFLNTRLAQLFSRSLHQTTQGTWLLTIGTYSYPVDVEDVGVHVHALQRVAGGWDARCNDGETHRIAEDGLLTDGDAWLGARLQDGRLARFIDAAHHYVGARLDHEDDPASGTGRWILREDGITIPIGLRSRDDGTKY